METTHVASAVEGEVQTAIGDVDEVILDPLALRKRGGIHELGSAELLRPFLLPGVDIDSDDPASTTDGGGGDDSKANGANTKHRDVGVLLRIMPWRLVRKREERNVVRTDSLLFGHSPPSGSDTASQQADLL